MKNIKVKKIMPRIVALLFVPFILTGCGKKSDCDITTSHLHLYTKNTEKGTISKYLDSEKLTYGNYNWNKDYIEITKEDENFYRAKGELFVGKDNWQYLFNTMKENSKDHLEFYYDYKTHYVVTMGSGKSRHTAIRSSRHTGWSDDPTHRGVTGEVKVCHHRFYGYNIVLIDGEYQKVQSPLVDDIREIINDYPYFSEECVEIVDQKHDFTKNIDILPSLKVSDFNDFTGPDLSSPELNISEIKANIK